MKISLKSITTINKDYFYALIVFYLIAISWSAVFSAVIGLPPTILHYPVVLLLLGVLWYSERVNKTFFLFCLIFMLIVLFIAIFKDAQIYINRFLFYPIILLLILFILKKDDILKHLSNLLTVYIVAAIILSIISLFYVYISGYLSTFEIANPDGRANHLYLFTFSNAVIGNIIRPSFIYDEAGAFSFIICYVAILRSMLSQNKLITLLIMVGGLITLSMTHVIILIVYLALEMKKKYYILLIPILFIITTWLYNQEDLKFFFERFEVSESGEIKGNNRSNQIDNFFSIANDDIILFGNYECDKKPNRVCIEHGDISSSPVTPVYSGGILLLLVQVITSIFLLWVAYKNKLFRFAGLAMFLLLLQRPYFTGIGYQLMVYTTLFFAIQSIYFNKGEYKEYDMFK